MDSERRAWLHRTARKCGYMLRRTYARELRKNQSSFLKILPGPTDSPRGEPSGKILIRN